MLCVKALELDDIDLRILAELQRDADRTNVDLARSVGLSPAAVLHRVRRLKADGAIRRVSARVDPERVGFPLRVFVNVTLGAHDAPAERRFSQVVHDLPQVIGATWVAGEVDAVLHVVARDITELQRVLGTLSTKGRAQRVVTLLHLAELKPPSPVPLGRGQGADAARPG
jgi:DNA-binding Lrp family transcriptional regulator